MRLILWRARTAGVFICLLIAVASACAAAAPLGAVIILSEGGEEAAAPEAFDVTVTFDAFDVRFMWGDTGGGVYGWIDLTGETYSAVTIKNNAAGQSVSVGVRCDAARAPAGIDRVGLSRTSGDVQYRDSLEPFTLSPQAGETIFIHYGYRAPSGGVGGSGSIQLTVSLENGAPEEPEV